MRFHSHRKRITEKHGRKFDNPDEVKRYEYLRLRFLAGEITEPEVHPAFPLLVNGQVVATYIADFRYLDLKTNQVMIEDCKPGMWEKKKQTRKGVVIREWRERTVFIEQLSALKIKWAEALYDMKVTLIWK